MIHTNCGCSPTNGACNEHKMQNALVTSVAEVVSEADEIAMAIERRLDNEGDKTDLRDCAEYGALCQQIDDLQDSKKWGTAAKLIAQRRPFDHYHVHCPESQ